MGAEACFVTGIADRLGLGARIGERERVDLGDGTRSGDVELKLIRLGCIRLGMLERLGRIVYCCVASGDFSGVQG
jgi:hypothetical protein